MNIVQIQNRVQELPNTPQTMQYLNAALNGQVKTIPPYIAAAELQRRESEGMADQLAKGAAQGPQPTVKDQLEEKVGIMALMGQQQPPQRPQIPQPAPAEPQPEAAGIDALPVKDDMFGMAGGGIVAFSNGGASGSWGPKPLDAEAQAALREAQRTGDRNAMLMTLKKLGAAGYDVATLIPRAFMGVAEDVANTRLGRALGVDFKLPASAYGGDRSSMTPMMDKVRRSEAGAAPAAQAALTSTPDVPSAKDRLSPEDMALRRQPFTASEAPARSNTVRPPAAAKPPTDKPPTDKPPTDTLPGINLADLAPGAPPRTLESSLASDPAYQKMMAAMGVANPYTGKQETQQEYIDRMRQGILSQTGGKMPYETSEARLKELEGRRAKEDADYAEAKKGRQLDNLLTFIGGMGRGSFGNAGVQGINAVQRVERDQRAEDLRRQDLRDQQAMKLMEIRSLNDQAQFELAKGNVQNHDALMREAKKLQAEFDFKQADLAKGVSQAGESARKGDVEDKRARDVLAEESRRAREKLTEEAKQKGLDRESSEKIARIQAAARQAGKGELSPAQAAKIMKDAEAAIAAREKNDTRLRMAYSKDPAARAAAVEAEANRLLGGYTSGSPSSKPDGGAPQGWGKPTVVKP
jgi:hypothetical protein